MVCHQSHIPRWRASHTRFAWSLCITPLCLCLQDAVPLGGVVDDTAKRSKEESAPAIVTQPQHFTHNIPSSIGPTPDRASEIQVLSRLDDTLVDVLLEGDIRLLRAAWLSVRPDSYRIERRQELEARELKGESPLLSRKEAADLVRRGGRGAGAFTYGWL